MKKIPFLKQSFWIYKIHMHAYKIQGVLKKLPKEMYDYSTLKMLPLIGSGVDKNIKLPSFRPIAQKPLFFNGKNSHVK